MRRTSNSSTFSPWKNNQKKDTPSTSKFKVADPKLGAKVFIKKIQLEPNSSRNHDIKCFKFHGRGHLASECPNQHTMIFNNREELEIEGENTNKEESSQEDDDEKENLFHIRCQVQAKICSMIIDGGSCSNVDYEDAFSDEIPPSLPPIRRIEYQTDFMPGAPMPNRPAYCTNPEEIKEIQRQIQEWMAKGYVRESRCPCEVPVLLVPKKDDPKEHLTAYGNILQLYGLLDALSCQIFVNTLYGKAQEWSSSFVPTIVVSYDQLARKFLNHFASKKRSKSSATYFFTLRQKDHESFHYRFNIEVLEVPDLKVDMMTSILIHEFKKGALASALA
ncbi:hypothetical protein Sango_1892200 [Sesamum angolense]|uniref:Retrotransposon gag domain-containing protein n=1 Tax=Sesamum angolense TaxID=2727404 RepID=A0AAE1WJ99_9LAMI|nr:hypothetical protein Sango_1892200 [Sesamum angolense]